MKTICIVICLSLASCAYTAFYEAGRKIAWFQGDMKGMTYHRGPAGEITWSGEIDHSGATEAQGRAARNVLLATSPVITATGLPGMVH